MNWKRILLSLLIVGSSLCLYAQKPEKPHRLSLKAEISKILYDSLFVGSKGEQSQIDFAPIIKEFNVKMVSPDGQFIICFNTPHLFTDYLYFFKKDGAFLSKQYIGFLPNIKFTSTGKYLEVFNEVGNEYFIFSVNGEVKKKGLYNIVLGIKGEFITNLAFIEDDELLLFGTSKAVYALGNNNEVNWKIDGMCLGIYYLTDKDVLIIDKVNFEKKEYDLRLVNKKGQTLDLIIACKDYFIKDDAIIIKFHDKIKKYEID